MAARNLQLGDRVGYSKAFLQSTGQQTGLTPFARGRITGLQEIGEIVLATVFWDEEFRAHCPDKINIANLWKVGTRED